MGLLRRKRGAGYQPPPSSEGCGAVFIGLPRLRPANSLSSSLHCRLGLPATLRRRPRDATLGCIRHTVVLAEVIQAFAAPENAVRMDEARDNACNDMGKMLQFVLPVATQIQQEVIKAYGFSCDGEGVLKFARLVKSYEAQDPEIASLSGKLKALFLPPMTLPPHGPASGGSVAAS
uniref:Protein C10 n=8 Tax=Boreoeutheria TaxID=1437010 RepID=A0A7J7Z0P2_MYOMY|nr:gene rich cluster C10 protein [Myotis myotis]